MTRAWIGVSHSLVAIQPTLLMGNTNCLLDDSLKPNINLWVYQTTVSRIGCSRGNLGRKTLYALNSHRFWRWYRDCPPHSLKQPRDPPIFRANDLRGEIRERGPACLLRSKRKVALAAAPDRSLSSPPRDVTGKCTQTDGLTYSCALHRDHCLTLRHQFTSTY